MPNMLFRYIPHLSHLGLSVIVCDRAEAPVGGFRPPSARFFEEEVRTADGKSLTDHAPPN